MAHKAKLYVGDKKKKSTIDLIGGNIEDDGYLVIECDYELVQPLTESGVQTGNPLCGAIHFSIVSPDDNDPFFYEWMHSKERHDGIIEFTLPKGNGQSTKTLRFCSAFCTHLHEYFNGQSDVQMYTMVTINAGEVSIGSTTFDNEEH